MKNKNLIIIVTLFAVLGFSALAAKPDPLAQILKKLEALEQILLGVKSNGPTLGAQQVIDPNCQFNSSTTTVQVFYPHGPGATATTTFGPCDIGRANKLYLNLALGASTTPSGSGGGSAQLAFYVEYADSQNGIWFRENIGNAPYNADGINDNTIYYVASSTRLLDTRTVGNGQGTTTLSIPLEVGHKFVRLVANGIKSTSTLWWSFTKTELNN